MDSTEWLKERARLEALAKAAQIHDDLLAVTAYLAKIEEGDQEVEREEAQKRVLG